MRSPSSLCLSPLSTVETIDRFYGIHYEDHATEVHLDAIILIKLLKSLKWRAFELLRWMQNLHQSTWDHDILYVERLSKDEQF
jgi:hypothetical protein